MNTIDSEISSNESTNERNEEDVTEKITSSALSNLPVRKDEEPAENQNG